MECYNQFSFEINRTTSYTSASGLEVRFSDLLSLGWVIKDSTTQSTFKVEGFKNINLYGVKMMGNIQSPIIGYHGIVDDFGFNLAITGTTPKISGTFTTNGYNVSTSSSNIQIGKYDNEIIFSEPIQSCTQISINNFQAQGYVPESFVAVDLEMLLTFISSINMKVRKLLFCKKPILLKCQAMQGCNLTK